MEKKTNREKIREIFTMLRLMDRFGKKRDSEAQLRNRELHPFSAAAHPLRGDNQPQGNPDIIAPLRYPVDGQVLLTKNQKYLRGRVVNISATGMFVACEKAVFNLNENVRVFIKPSNGDRTYQAMAQVVRFNRDPRFKTGYGLKFSTMGGI